MSSTSGIVLAFEVENFAEVSGLLSTLFLKFFVQDGTIEIMGADGKAFLKRIYYPEVQFDQLFIGNSLTIFNRLYTIRKYANKATEQYMSQCESHLLVETKDIESFIKIISLSKTLNLTIGMLRSVGECSSCTVDGLRVSPESILIEFVGVTQSKSDILQSFQSKIKQIGDVSAVQMSQQRIEEVFSLLKSNIIIPDNSTLCILKPHILRDKQVGDVIKFIVGSGFRVSALLSVHLTLSMAEELLGVYRTVLPSYLGMIEHVCSGPVIAIAVSGLSQRPVVDDFRDLCGPVYPDLAKAVRPKSLRAVFGQSSTQNAVHCTDLPEDGGLECRYIFETLGSL